MELLLVNNGNITIKSSDKIVYKAALTGNDILMIYIAIIRNNGEIRINQESFNFINSKLKLEIESEKRGKKGQFSKIYNINKKATRQS